MPRSPDELREASNHLFYEIEMLRSTAELLGTGAFGDSQLANALIESFTIHARALIDFLYGERSRDDVLAEDFFPEGVWERPTPPANLDVDAIRRRVGKEIAHLTYDRQQVTLALKGWNYVEVGNAILRGLEEFAMRVSPDLLGERWPRTGGHPVDAARAIVVTQSNYTTNL